MKSENFGKLASEFITITDAETSGLYYSSDTILFADIVRLTSKVERMSPVELSRNQHHA